MNNSDDHNKTNISGDKALTDTQTPLASSTQPLGDAARTQSVTDNKTNLDQRLSSNTSIDKTESVGTVELLEERAVVNKERISTGKITVSKQQRTRTANIPVELTEEVLVINTEYLDSDNEKLLLNNAKDKDIVRYLEPQLNSDSTRAPSITVNGKQITLGQEPVEIVLSREIATIQKETYAVQEVDISKSAHTHSEQFDVELRHEELDIDESDFTETGFVYDQSKDS